MIEKNRLAVVIPAYKLTYFNETLESLANQECKDFVLYIGDDASPEDLKSVVDRHRGRINIVYRRFEENLGGKDLVAHWERCIALTQGEEWIWLFSDDDIMEPSCVKNFFGCLMQVCSSDLFHFNLKIIDNEGDVTKECNPYPEYMSVSDFFDRRIGFKINSAIVEYIFSRQAYEREGGFKKNDMAWCTDDASWIRMGRKTGILTIPGSTVSWRNGGLNISSNVKDRKVVLRKLKANVEHINWVTAYFKEFNLKSSLSSFAKLKWAISVLVVSPSFTSEEKYSFSIDAARQLGLGNMGFYLYAYLFYRRLKK